MNSAPGFTLMEVLVALVVAALLASGLLALQRHGLNQARDGDTLWIHVNLAQEALMGKDLARMRDDTGWLWPQQHPDRQWRIVATPILEGRSGPWMMLTTRTPERTLDWLWPGVRP